jgi:hypothetical protein
MSTELILCIPGPWKDRSEFLRSVITLEPIGQFMFAGGILADVGGKDHLPVEFTSADSHMAKAFEIAGQGRLPQSTLAEIELHQSVVYVHASIDIQAERTRLLTFTKLLQRLGGHAIKLETAGIAHSWERWFALLNGSLFDLYCACVVLVSDNDYYYSCGMHHFGLSECAVPTTVDLDEAADLMNRFNFWQIAEQPTMKPGHTFSLSNDAPVWHLALENDNRHDVDDLFFNQHGVWVLRSM